MISAALRCSLALASCSAASAQTIEDAIVTKSGELAPPQDGLGQVVFFRPKALMWAVLPCGVREGDAQVAKLAVGKYQVVPARPGKHVFTAGSGERSLTVQVGAGQTHFVLCTIGKGLIGRARLTRSDRYAFEDRASALTMSNALDN